MPDTSLAALRARARREPYDAVAADELDRALARSGQCDPVDILIKTHSRPFALDRLIRSIDRLVRGYRRILVLDDGLATADLARIADMRDDIAVVRSPRAAGRTGPVLTLPARREGRRCAPGSRHNPAAFWIDIVERHDSSRFLLTEEDCWFVEPVDLALLAPVLHRDAILGCRLGWAGNPRRAGFDGAHIDLPLGNGMGAKRIAPRIVEPDDVMKVNPICNAVYRRDWWLGCHRDLARWNDEDRIRAQGLAWLDARRRSGRDAAFLVWPTEAIRQGYLTTGRSDGGAGMFRGRIDPASVNAALTDAWRTGALDPMAGYPADHPPALLEAILAARLAPEDVAAWKSWLADYTALYASFGTKIW